MLPSSGEGAPGSGRRGPGFSRPWLCRGGQAGGGAPGRYFDDARCGILWRARWVLCSSSSLHGCVRHLETDSRWRVRAPFLPHLSARPRRRVRPALRTRVLVLVSGSLPVPWWRRYPGSVRSPRRFPTQISNLWGSEGVGRPTGSPSGAGTSERWSIWSHLDCTEP